MYICNYHLSIKINSIILSDLLLGYIMISYTMDRMLLAILKAIYILVSKAINILL